jgi:hypothetical protein
MQNQDEKIVKSNSAGQFAHAAAIDVKRRCAAANEAFSDKFENPIHTQKVDVIRAIVQDYFQVFDMYENQRSNRGRPFTVIKICNHSWPRVSLSEKNRRFRQPIEDLGLDIKSTTNNALLIHIPCE